jgi:hypothetical protein
MARVTFKVLRNLGLDTVEDQAVADAATRLLERDLLKISSKLVGKQVLLNRALVVAFAERESQHVEAALRTSRFVAPDVRAKLSRILFTFTRNMPRGLDPANWDMSGACTRAFLDAPDADVSWPHVVLGVVSTLFHEQHAAWLAPAKRAMHAQD